MNQKDIFIGRQPILDEKGSTVAYELLYREGDRNAFPSIDGSEATSHLLYNLFMTDGLDGITGGRPAFINFTKGMLLSGLPPLDPQRVVIEILEDTVVDPPLVRAVHGLAEQRFKIAFDDFSFDPSFAPLVGLASVIKVDWRGHAHEKIPGLISSLNSYKGAFLAEKIETREEFRTALSMGFSLFQGYFFMRPEIMVGRDIPPATWSLLGILSAIQQPEIDFDEFTKLIGRDPTLCYKLLALVNSAAHGLRQPVSSIRQAALFLGEQEIRRWFSFLVLYHVRQDRTPEILLTACIRARFAECLAAASGRPELGPKLHLAGLLSSIDALLGRPLEECLARTKLVETDIENALIGKTGPLAPWLALVEAHERADVETVGAVSADLGLTDMDVLDAYLQAIAWSMDFVMAQGQ